MKTGAINITLRYLAILIQFSIAIFVARNLELEAAGKYFAVFGLIIVACTLSGLGIPDGCVKILNEARVRKDAQILQAISRSVLPACLLINLMIAPFVGFTAYIFADLDQRAIFIVSLWWFGYAGTFFFSQFLIGAGKAIIATFWFYSSINLMYLVTLLPALIYLENPELLTIFFFALAGANFAMLGASLVYKKVKRDLISNEIEMKKGSSPLIYDYFHEIFETLYVGAPMMISRFMQASLPWIPVWMLAYLHSPEASAVYAMASRLTVAVTSVVASLRFSMRHLIIEANVAGEYEKIATLNRSVSIVSIAPPIIGLIFLITVGTFFVSWIFGPNYERSLTILCILMFGVIAEAFGGLSDEILKMIGQTRVVIFSLIAAILCQFFVGLFFANLGPVYLAGGTVFAFTVQYFWQVAWLSRKTQISILPFISKQES